MSVNFSVNQEITIFTTHPSYNLQDQFTFFNMDSKRPKTDDNDKKQAPRDPKPKNDDKPNPGGPSGGRGPIPPEYREGGNVKQVKPAEPPPISPSVVNAKPAAQRKQGGNRALTGPALNVLEIIPPEALKTVKMGKSTKKIPQPPKPAPQPIHWWPPTSAIPDVEGPSSMPEKDNFKPKAQPPADNPPSEAAFGDQFELPEDSGVKPETLPTAKMDDPLQSTRTSMPTSESPEPARPVPKSGQTRKIPEPGLETTTVPPTKSTRTTTLPNANVGQSVMPPSKAAESTTPNKTTLEDNDEPELKQTLQTTLQDSSKSSEPQPSLDAAPKSSLPSLTTDTPKPTTTIDQSVLQSKPTADRKSEPTGVEIESEPSVVDEESSLFDTAESTTGSLEGPSIYNVDSESESSVDPESTLIPTTDHITESGEPTSSSDYPTSFKPIASKIVFFRPPEPSPETGTVPFFPSSTDEDEPRQTTEPAVFIPKKHSSPAEIYHGGSIPLYLFPESAERLLKENEEDKDIENKLNELIDDYRGEQLKKLKNAAKARAPKYIFGDMIKTLQNLEIPCPTNDDFGILQGTHNRWDPDGTVVEYFSPMLRTFLPVNMRGRYRGCWPTDTCMKGVNISKISPKRDALEGFVERGRHDNIQQKYDEMSEVAVDETHLDYLIEMQAFQAETLPIPIFYDMLHLGMQVANESLRILVQEQGYPPNNKIFRSQLQHAEQLRRKIQLYGALGLETLESKRRGLGEYLPHWLKTRDEIIRDVMSTLDAHRYEKMKRKEEEGRAREMARRQQWMMERMQANSAAATAAPASTSFQPAPTVTADKMTSNATSKTPGKIPKGQLGPSLKNKR